MTTYCNKAYVRNLHKSILTIVSDPSFIEAIERLREDSSYLRDLCNNLEKALELLALTKV